MSPLAQQWSEVFQAEDSLAGPPWLQDIRRNAARQLGENGLPRRKDEAWKYTPMRFLEELAPVTGKLGEVAGSSEAVEFTPLLDEVDCVIDIRDGKLATQPAGNRPGLSIVPLAEGLKTWESRLKKHIEALDTSGSAGAFAALNTAFLEHGLVIHVAPETDAGSVLLRWGSSGNSEPTLRNFRIFVLLEPGCRLELTEQFESPALTGQALNVIAQFELGSGAELNHIRVQKEPESSVILTSARLSQEQDSRYDYAGFDLGGGLVRHELHASLDGAGAQANFRGAFVLDHKRHVDNHICVEHVAKDCSSEQFFRGVLGGRSRGVFNGKALIRPGADGSNVRQSNANLLLSDLAEIDTKPELEIYADEVVASHGATVGQLDEAAVFYLRSRGLSDAAARRMLTGAFCRAVTDRLGQPGLADRIAQMMDEAMPSGPGI